MSRSRGCCVFVRQIDSFPPEALEALAEAAESEDPREDPRAQELMEAGDMMIITKLYTVVYLLHYNILQFTTGILYSNMAIACKGLRERSDPSTLLPRPIRFKTRAGPLGPFARSYPFNAYCTCAKLRGARKLAPRAAAARAPSYINQGGAVRGRIN